MIKANSVPVLADTSQDVHLMAVSIEGLQGLSIIIYAELIEYVNLSNNQEKAFETEGHHYYIIKIL